MKFSELLNGVRVKEINGEDREIRDITADSNGVIPDGLFICVRGENYDGHEFIKQVESYGGAAVVSERKLDTYLPQAVVEDTREAISVIAANFYGNADKKMKIIGVTGTNGKTTTTHLITSVLANAGVKCGLIGTLGVFYGDKFTEPTLTTPDPIELQRTLSEMYKSGVEAVVMEVSAHALYYKKIYGMNFEVAVFTNFSQDHLDFFKDMENYRRAKKSFFERNACKYIVSNSDDLLGAEIAGSRSDNVITYGIDEPADVFAIDVKNSDRGSEFIMNLFDKIYEVKLNLYGKYNVYNALAAATASALYGVPTDKVAEGIDSLKGVSGRLECVYDGEFTVYIDYAHTPDGLKKSLQTLKELAKNRLISVFGCGGNRDVKKRPIMGRVSGEIVDFTVLTSDNPRYEEPMEILSQIESGIKDITENYVIVQERKDGIIYALEMAEKGDIVLIAGKGGEKYQEIFGVKKAFSDKAVVKEYFGRKK